MYSKLEKSFDMNVTLLHGTKHKVNNWDNISCIEIMEVVLNCYDFKGKKNHHKNFVY